MDEKRWKLVERLYEEVRHLPPAERAVVLSERSGADATLVTEVEALLSVQGNAEDFFGDLHQSLFSDDVQQTVGASERSDPLIGSRLAHYEIERLLGVGGMGIVYLARDVKLDRQVALKVLSPHLDADEEARQRFLIEAKAASRLAHPHVATIYGVEEVEGGRMAIAMSYCSGGSLKELLKEGPLLLDDAVKKVMQIGAGLQAAHDKGIIHRDVKPANIMIGEGGTLQIVDFGLARITGLTGITRSGSTMGTVAYMAPEVVRDGHSDHRSDIWALGVVLYELVAGQTPFIGEQVHTLLYALVHEPPIPVAGLRPGVPSQLEFAIHKALAKEPEARYQDMASFLDDLQIVLDKKTTVAAEAKHSVQPVLEVDPQPASERGPIKLLVVDDEPDVELLLRQQYLKKIRAGEWQLMFAENGAIALERLREQSDIRVILTDIQMPVMDGLTFLNHLNQSDVRPKAIVVSAYGDMQNLRRAMNLGAFDFITKPIQFADLEITINKAIREAEEIEQARASRSRLAGLENELALVRQVQQAILPQTWPESDEVQIYAYMEPAREVNGDFYDVFYLDDDRLGFFIGDVAGQGFSAAMFMAMCRTLLKADARRGKQPAECMKALSEFLYPEHVEGIFITAFYGILDCRTGLMTYCNAGHIPPWMTRGDGSIEKTRWSGGVGIGILKSFEYIDEQVHLGPSDGLLLFTDGLIKAKNEHGELYPEAHIEEVLARRSHEMPPQLIRSLIRDLAEFTLGAQQADDMTLLAIRRTVEEPQSLPH